MLSNLLHLLPLLLTISFSSSKPFLKNEIIPFTFQPNSLKLYDFLIYPSNDGFKNYILPFLSSEKLLKIFLYFQNLDSNIRIQKFLPDSTVTTTPIDFQNSYIAYIFENEFSFFNPIICDSEQHYRIVTLGCGAAAPAAAVNHTEVNPIYALFPSNKIFRLHCHLLSQNQKVFAAVDEESSFFCVVVMENSENKLTFIANGTPPLTNYLQDRPDANLQLILNLDCFLDANNLNCLKKFYFKVFYLRNKFDECIQQTRWGKFMIYFRDRSRESPWKSCPLKMLWQLWILFSINLYFIGSFPLYHVTYFPFYILSLPFAFVSFQDNFIYDRMMTKPFILFWIIPSFFRSIDFLFYFKLYKSKMLNSEKNNTSMQTKPPELKWAVSYFMFKKPNRDACAGTCESCIDAFCAILVVAFIFWVQFEYSFPFSVVMIMQEANK